MYDQEGREIFIPRKREDNRRLCQVRFEPLGNWLLIKQVDAAVEKSGLIIPEAYGQTFRKGVVAATGKGTVYSSGTFIECTVEVGDTVMFGKAAGLELMLEEGGFVLIRESECFGRIPPDGTAGN